jgi:hypothetical protein
MKGSRMHHRRRAKVRGRAPASIMLEALIGGALLATVSLGLVGQLGADDRVITVGTSE